jgi:chromate transporter
VQLGLAPIAIGLMAAGTISIARTAINGPATIALAAIVFGILYFTKTNPALLIFAGGAAGFVFLH